MVFGVISVKNGQKQVLRPIFSNDTVSMRRVKQTRIYDSQHLFQNHKLLITTEKHTQNLLLIYGIPWFHNISKMASQISPASLPGLPGDANFWACRGTSNPGHQLMGLAHVFKCFDFNATMCQVLGCRFYCCQVLTARSQAFYRQRASMMLEYGKSTLARGYAECPGLLYSVSTSSLKSVSSTAISDLHVLACQFT